MHCSNLTKVMFLVAILLCVIPVENIQAGKSISAGETFPEVMLPAPLELEQCRYLGIPTEQPFTFRQIDGRVVLIEVLNVHCPHCQKQTAPYNRLYRMIEADPETRGKIKMVGVAVANDAEAIDDFVVIYSVAFPIVSDRNFKLHSAVQAGETPFSLYAMRDSTADPFVVAGSHLGSDDKMEELFVYLKDLLLTHTSEFTSLPKEEVVAEVLEPPQSRAEITKLVTAAFARQGILVDAVTEINLPSGRNIFTVTVEKGGALQPLYVEVASRSAICDVCHSVHFFYVFDHSGLIVDFVPLSLTKYGNVEWNQDEVDFFRSRVVGRQLTGGWEFDSKVDSVSSATMTSAIIFDDLNHGGKLLEELRREKILRD